MIDRNAEKDSRKRTREPSPPPEPVNRIDGIPDRRERRPRWIYGALAAVFVLWLAFLAYVKLAG